MKKFASVLLLLCTAVSLLAQTVKIPMDSKWKKMPLTRDAKLTVIKDGLELINRNSSRAYAGANLKKTVDLTATPYLVVDVREVTNCGHLKVVCGKAGRCPLCF